MKPNGVRCWLVAALTLSPVMAQAATCEQAGKTLKATAEVLSPGPLRIGAASLTIPAEVCRLTLTLKPSSDSDIRTEIWLPAANWNGKLQGIGNGGFAGSIDFYSLASAVSHGYAAAATDTGHHTSGADWALHHPEKITDFGYRAIHETALAAKAAIQAFYGDPPKHSYFNACSNGGRQGLMEAQRYPEDFDGIAAGAPANQWTHLMTTLIANSQALAEAGPGFTAAKLPAIQTAALNACDALDGVEDGIIEDPTRCHFDPGTLLCKGAETDACLTAGQIGAIRKIYAQGYQPGGEAEPLDWGEWLTGRRGNPPLQSDFGTGFFKFMVYDDPAWNYATSNPAANQKRADQKLAHQLNATDPDLSRFATRGGKLILYHGWNDAAIPPQNTIDYYDAVISKAGVARATNFIRLYMVPGWGHCGGGNGPDIFGQSSVPRSDPDHDLAAALEQWVEKGYAPQRIVATQKKPARTGPLCAFPLTAHWNGTGSTDDAASFDCK